MVKKKQFLTPKKESKKKKPTEPETANQFLEVGVEREEAGEKWRAGDAAKASRFFLRAIETYDEGLKKFPEEFDLAYNKARLQYEVTEQPKLLVHIETPLEDLLQVALESHRYALTIDQDNADLLFNTAQVLTSIAETITEGRNPSDDARDQGIKLLQESLEFWQRCLTVQEYQLNQAEELDTEEGGVEIAEDGNEDTPQNQQSSEPPTEEEGEETYATVLTPPTPSAILDTMLAQLETLSTLATLSSSQPSPLPWIQEYYTTILLPKLASLSTATSRTPETNLATAKFRTTFAEHSYRTGQIDAPTYERELSNDPLLKAIDENTSAVNDPLPLCLKADAELAFCLSVRLNSESDSLSREDNARLYHHASLALEAYTAAFPLPQPPTSSTNLPAIHLRRGDCELLRWSLLTSSSNDQTQQQEDGANAAEGEADSAMDLDPSETQPATILANAALNYRMAGRAASSTPATSLSRGSGSLSLSVGAGEAKEEGKEAYLKGLVVEVLGGGEGEAGGGWSEETRQDVRECVEGLGEEGVLGRAEVERVVV